MSAAYDDQGRPHDSLGRRMPQGFRSTLLMRAVPGLYDQFDAIPGEFWNEDDDAETRMAVVACPCGESPSVELDKFQECKCERFFWFIGKDVRVANSPKGVLVAAVPDPEEENDGRQAGS